MTEEELQVYYDKFPVILRGKLKNRLLRFPGNTKFVYEPIEAYRVVVRAKDDKHALDMEDMKSYYERGKRLPGVQVIDETDPLYYAVSLFESMEALKQSFNFPRPNKKMAHGYVYEEGGPCLRGVTGHISWWLFENVDLRDFEIMEE